MTSSHTSTSFFIAFQIRAKVIVQRDVEVFKNMLMIHNNKFDFGNNIFSVFTTVELNLPN
jgi:hypothetical protein